MWSHQYTFKALKPKVINDLVRVGNKETDGGYLLSKRQIPITKILVGLGVNYDWTFEAEFKKLNPSCTVQCYDFSVSKTVYLKAFISSVFNVISINSYTKEIFNKRSPHTVLQKPFKILNTYFKFKKFFNPAKHNYFFQKGVSNETYDQFISAKEMFANISAVESLPDNSIFIKMDIEQSEYDILEDILTYSKKINGLIIEFHDLRHFWTDFTHLINRTNEDFEIIHLHGNNSDGYIPHTRFPNLIEVTFIKKNLLTEEEMRGQNKNSYPLTELDKPNILGKSDLAISFD